MKTSGFVFSNFNDMSTIVIYAIINAKDNRFYDSVVMTLEKHLSNLAIWVRLLAGMLFITFLLNYFCTIIFSFYLYMLEVNFPLTFPDVTVTAMPVTNCVYNFSFCVISFGYGCR